MSPQEQFKDKPLRLGVVAALTTITALSADAIVLPSKPLALSSSWDCRAGKNNDWLCRSSTSHQYTQTLERASFSERNYRQESNYNSRYQTEQPRKAAQAQYQEPPRPQSYTAYDQSAIYNQPAGYGQPASYEQPSRYATSDQETAQTRIQSLLSARDGSYMVQWLAAHNEEVLKDIQRRFPFLEQSTVVSYRRNNKIWYVLLDGPFDSREAAMAALSSPPRLLMTDKLYPWTRSLSSIQKLDLIMPNEIEPVPSYDQPTVANRYDYQSPAQQPSSRLFASISPAYPQMEQSYEPRDYNTDSYDPYAPVEDQYRARNRQYERYEPEYREPRQRRSQSSYSEHQGQDQNFSDNRRRSYDDYRESRDVSRARSQARRYYDEEPVYQTGNEQDDPPRDIINAPDGSYTIQWLNSPRREALERAKRRYPQLDNAEIIQYRKGGRKWYLLVSELYFSASKAKRALNEPWLARVSTRLYPRVRSVNSLRVLVSDNHQGTSKRQKILASSPLNEIIKSPDGTYTIQWFAANSPGAVEKMKQRFPELRSAITAYYHKNQKDWYVLIQGQYSSSREAIATIKSPQLQNAVRVLHPWTRPVKSLKKLRVSNARYATDTYGVPQQTDTLLR